MKGKENKIDDTLNKKFHAVVLSICDSDLNTRVLKAQIKDETYLQVKEKLQQEETNRKYERYQLKEDGILVHRDMMYITNCTDLKRMLMDDIHQKPYSCHPGYQKTMTTVRKQYSRPGMKKDIPEYISRCHKCQQK